MAISLLDATAYDGGDEDFSTLPDSQAGKKPADTPDSELGFLLDEPDETKVFKRIEQEWKRGERAARNRVERTKRNNWWRQGKRFARLEEKTEDKGLIKATLPPGMSSQPPMPNKVDDLCRKIGAQITIDPPAPDVEPQTDSDEDRGAAEFATRFLKSDGSEAGTNDAAHFRRAIDGGMTAGSVFTHEWVDPNGNGWRPREIKAHPLAIDAENPLVGAPQVDPATGMEVPAPHMDFITRYVTPDGQITDNPTEADRQWLPKIKAELVPHPRVRLLPETVEHLDEATGVILCLYKPLNELRAIYETPEEPWSDEFVNDLIAWEPQNLKTILPPAQYKLHQDRKGKLKEDDRKKAPEDALVFFFLRYQKATPEYPEGACVAVNGGGEGVVLFREPWAADVELRGKGTKRECLDIPVIQWKHFPDVDGDWAGMGAVELFGAGDEQRAMVLSAWNEWLDIFLHPNVFLPVTSPVQPKQLGLRDGTPIPVLSKEDMPFYEDAKTFPADGKEYLRFISEEMNSASGLQETAQGLESPNSESGVAKRAVIEQAQVALGPLFSSYTDGAKRFWRIKLQLARAKMTVPQLMGYVGDDGAYKQEYWTGADFSGTRDVNIARGSGTMMSPTAKQQWLMGMLAPVQRADGTAAPLIDPVEVVDMIRSDLSQTTGLQDDPHLQRIKRQISAFMDGPPEGFQPAGESVDPMTGQPTPANYTPFDPRPNDEEPMVARVRHRELTRVMSGSQYAKQPPEWRQVFDTEYQRMAYAAGVVTVRQQAEAQQQQAQMQQQQAEQQMMQAEQQHGQKMSQSEQAHQQQLQQGAEKNAAQMQADAQKAALSNELARQSAAVKANQAK